MYSKIEGPFYTFSIHEYNILMMAYIIIILLGCVESGNILEFYGTTYCLFLRQVCQIMNTNFDYFYHRLVFDYGRKDLRIFEQVRDDKILGKKKCTDIELRNKKRDILIEFLNRLEKLTNKSGNHLYNSLFTERPRFQQKIYVQVNP